MGYIRAVTRIAKSHFGSRVQFWHEGGDTYGHYDREEVNESLERYEQVSERRNSVTIRC
jgi:enoyl reductase-like protein